jgi:hypothetical protein
MNQPSRLCKKAITHIKRHGMCHKFYFYQYYVPKTEKVRKT